MRIGFVTDSYKPYVSGVTNFISLNRHYLEDHGHETYVFAFNESSADSTEPRVSLSPGIPVRGTDGFRLGCWLTAEARSLLATMDVVHIDNPFSGGLLAGPICRRHGIPMIYTNHTRVDLYADYYISAVPAGALTRPVGTYMRRFCREADLVISPTETMASVLRELGVDCPITVVRNGVDIERFRDAARAVAEDEAARVQRRADFGASEDDVVFVYSGRLSPEKNLGVLIEAFSAVARRMPARLVLLGDGPVRAEIEQLVAAAGLSECVFFAGMVPYAEMGTAVAPFDIWVSASVSEVDPLSLIEAMAAGLPSVTFDAPGMCDTVKDGITGLLATPAEPAALAEKMLALCLDPDRRRALGVGAQKAAERFSIAESGARMLELYEEIVRTRAARGKEHAEPGIRAATRIRHLPPLRYGLASPDRLRSASLLARRTTTFLVDRPSHLKRRARSAFVRSRRALKALRGRI